MSTHPEGSPAAGAALDVATARAIAAAYLPRRWYGSRWHHYYARFKLASDPLYPGVVDALRGSDAPLVDLGCGPGLLAHALRAAGLDMPYRGVDHDASKIRVADAAACRAGLADVDFEALDLGLALPAHRGSVAVLDVLQYLDDAAQARTLDGSLAMLVPGARLVIRTGLADGSRRARFSRGMDRAAHRIGWMQSAPMNYPVAEALSARFTAAGADAAFTPLSGRTPFNNWLVVVRR